MIYLSSHLQGVDHLLCTVVTRWVIEDGIPVPQSLYAAGMQAKTTNGSHYNQSEHSGEKTFNQSRRVKQQHPPAKTRS